MTNLKSLNAYGRSRVKGDFLATEHHGVRFRDEDFNSTEAQCDDRAVQRLLDGAMQGHPAGKAGAGMDVELAPALHQAMPFDRRTASDTGIWHYLSVVEFESFVRYRWGGVPDGRVSEERFLGSLKRNALARLWWAAELSVQEGDDYSVTERLLAPPGGQDLLEQVLGRRFSNYKPATVAYVKLVGGKPRAVTRAVAETLSQTLMTVVLEVLGPAEAESLVHRILQRIEGPQSVEAI